jgi:hypothetical protein
LKRSRYVSGKLLLLYILRVDAKLTAVPFRSDRNGRSYENDLIIDRHEKKGPARRPRRWRSPEPYNRKEVTWQRHNGARRSKSIVDVEQSHSDAEAGSEPGRIARRHVGIQEKRDRLWTEITKDLVLREAIERAGYEYEEAKSFYYVFAYLRYVCLPFFHDLFDIAHSDPFFLVYF